ncbi:MAG: hypothetical protein K8T91_00835 [Planctomycetes bacterium]|nr:hypothetical protein [Planctomycetota bacterium]
MIRRIALGLFILLAILVLSVFAFRNADGTSMKASLQTAKKTTDSLSADIQKEIAIIEKLPAADPLISRTIAAFDKFMTAAEKQQGASPTKDFEALQAERQILRAALLASISEHETNRQRLLATLTASQREADTTGAAFDRLLNTPDKLSDKIMLGIKEFLSYLSLPLLLLLALICYSIFPPSCESLARALESFSSIKLAGAEVVLTQQLRRNSAEVVETFREKVTKTFSTLAEKHDLTEKLQQVLASPTVTTAMDVIGIGTIPGFRATIHVPDMFFSHTLCQLLNYYPDQHNGRPSAHGAIKSIRFGIIGRSWRLRECDKSNVEADQIQLMKHWGMTKDEAKKATAHEGPKTVSATLLLDQVSQQPVAVLYMDASNADAFGNAPDFHQVLQQACIDTGLTKALGTIVEKAKVSAPLIRID